MGDRGINCGLEYRAMLDSSVRSIKKVGLGASEAWIHIRVGREEGGVQRPKHDVTFDEACTAFQDSLALLMPDPDHSVGEER